MLPASTRVASSNDFEILPTNGETSTSLITVEVFPNAVVKARLNSVLYIIEAFSVMVAILSASSSAALPSMRLLNLNGP